MAEQMWEKDETAGRTAPELPDTLLLLASAERRAGALPEAARCLSRTICLLQKSLGQTHARIGFVLAVLSEVHGLCGRPMMQKLTAERALRTDASNEDVARALRSLANAHQSFGDGEAAASAFARAAQMEDRRE